MAVNDPSSAEQSAASALFPVLGSRVWRYGHNSQNPMRERAVHSISALLVSDELCVGDLAIALDANERGCRELRPLGLRNVGVVQRRREGRMGYYRVCDGAARQQLGAVLAHLRALAALQPDNGAEGSDV